MEEKITVKEQDDQLEKEKILITVSHLRENENLAL